MSRSILHGYFNPLVFWYQWEYLLTSKEFIGFAGYLRLAMMLALNDEYILILEWMVNGGIYILSVEQFSVQRLLFDSFCRGIYYLVNELIMNHGVKSQRVKDLYFQSPFYHHVTGIHQLRSCRVCGNKLAPVFCQRLRTWRTWSIFEQIGLGPFNSTWCSSWFTIWLFNIAMENPL